jgi:hypothetical protein
VTGVRYYGLHYPLSSLAVSRLAETDLYIFISRAPAPGRGRRARRPTATTVTVGHGPTRIVEIPLEQTRHDHHDDYSRLAPVSEFEDDDSDAALTRTRKLELEPWGPGPPAGRPSAGRRHRSQPQRSESERTRISRLGQLDPSGPPSLSGPAHLAPAGRAGSGRAE